MGNMRNRLQPMSFEKVISEPILNQNHNNKQLRTSRLNTIITALGPILIATMTGGCAPDTPVQNTCKTITKKMEAGGLTPGEKNALLQILRQEKIWSKASEVLGNLPAWESIGQCAIHVFPNATVGGLPYTSMEEAKRAVQQLQQYAAKANVAAYFPDDDSLRVRIPADTLNFPEKLSMTKVHELLGNPTRIEKKVIHSIGERRPLVLTVHYYAGGSIAFAESDWSPEPGIVDRVILDVQKVLSAVRKE